MGTDNPAFSADDLSADKDTANHVVRPHQMLSTRTVQWDFKAEDAEEDSGEEEEEKYEEGDSEYDSIRSQHTPHGSVGHASRLADFEGEPTDLDEEKDWDVFEETPWENLAHADREFWSSVKKVSRVILMLLLFLLVLGTSSLSNFTFLLIVYNMNASSRNFTLLEYNQSLQTKGEQVQVRWVWAAMMVISAPYFFTLLACLQKMCNKRTRSLAWRPLLIALLVETVHSVGLGAFVFIVSPSYDPLMVIVLSYCVTFVPSLLQTYRVSRTGNSQETGFSWLFLMVTLSSLAVPALLVYRLYDGDSTLTLTLLTYFSLLLLSFEWWENFVAVTDSWKQQRWKEIRQWQRRSTYTGRKKGKRNVSFQAGSWLFRLKYSIRDRKTKIEAVCAAWKLVLTLVVIPLVVFASAGDTVCASALFYRQDTADSCTLLGHLNLCNACTDWCCRYLPFLVAGIGILASGVAYKAAKVACKIHAQVLCFAMPLLLSAPLTLVVVVLTYQVQLKLGNCTNLRWPLLHDVDIGQLLKEYSKQFWGFLIVLGMALLGATTFHVWSSSAERVATTEKLFVRPLYCGVMFAQSVLLNRAVDDDDAAGVNLTSASRSKEDTISRLEKRTERFTAEEIEEEMRNSVFPRIYACATMWHETEKEMAQLLKSIFRMDRDQSVRSYMWKNMNVVDKDFYLFEGHIFFDDAFKRELTDSGEEYFVLNSYVKTFVEMVYEAARSIYPPNIELVPPTKMETPYGGRLTYTLPGTNPLVVHLKNKYLIRHKKRWSQVMYMYYLLSYKLLLGEQGGQKRRRLANNTFLLALDGDVDFYPDAVQLLVDRMRRNKHVGAACGRIHPIGSGMMVWYQKFEYAVSHWLQKATEHVLGCVLCSPGCFSLFRASALMDDNVLRRYTKQATQARHAVQYDMGEDRWLCTLLLQQGWRVEYAAAADALTFCPDSFNEFFKQRRRWTPSTMANILDLLSDWRRVTRVNSSISLLFIAYQMLLFVSGLLTPGTIFLLILGAINTAYPSMPLYGAMLANLVPVVIFLVICFTASHDVQISFTGVLSMLYSLVMMVVLVGLLRQVAESGMCSVTAIFFVGVAGIFCLAAVIHPQEIGNLLYGLLYFLLIPCTSMLLIFYAVCNLNVVTWGTRDDTKPSSGAGPARPSPQSGLQKLQGGLKRMMSMGGGAGDGGRADTSDYTFSFGNLFRCICCPVKKENADIMERFEDLEIALHDLRRTLTTKAKRNPRHQTEEEGEGEEEDKEQEWSGLSPLPSPPAQLFYGAAGSRETSNPLFGLYEGRGEPGEKRRPGSGPLDFEDRYLWIEDPELDCGFTDFLPAQEKKFWEELIETYLAPLDKNSDYADKEEAMAKELTALRNQTAMMFFLSNALFVTVIFILESVAEYTPDLTLELPCDKGHVGQKIEPISITFTVVFGILLLLQCGGMLMHRFSTLVHIVAATTLNCLGRRPKPAGDQDDLNHFSKYGTEDLYRFTQDMMVSSRLKHPEELSEGTSLVGGQSISKETVTSSGGGNIVSKIFERQKSRKRISHLQTLHDAMNECFLPMLDSMENDTIDNSQEEGIEQVDGAVNMEMERREDPIPQGLNWRGERFRKVFEAFAKDPEKIMLMKQRTQKIMEKWRSYAKRFASGNPPTSFVQGNQPLGTGEENSPENSRPRDIADVVRQLRQQQKMAALQQRGIEESKDVSAGEDPNQDPSTEPKVKFSDETRGMKRSGAFSGQDSPARDTSGRPSSRWRKVKEADSMLTEMASANAETMPLTTVVDVHDPLPPASSLAGTSPGGSGKTSARVSEVEEEEEEKFSITQM